MFKFNRDSEQIPEVSLTISNRTLLRVVVVVIVVLALIAGVMKVTHALLLLFIAFFLAIALNAPVAAVGRFIPGKRRGNRSLATTMSFLIFIIVIGAFAAYIIPPLVHQTEKFVSAAPNLVQNAKNQHTSLGHFIRVHNLQNEVDSLSRQISQWAKNASGKAFSGITEVLSSLFSLLAVLALTFMMLVEGPRWINFTREFVPERHAKRVDRMVRDMYEVVRGYVNGQVLLAFIAGVMIAPALFLTHVSYPIALMVVVFLAGLIPVIGHTIGAIIVTIVALFHSLPAALIVLVYYIFYMQVENYLLQPRIQANTTNMSPLLVFASLIIGINFAGLFGGLVAIPIAGCLRVLVLEYLSAKKMLPDSLADELVGVRRPKRKSA